MAGVICSKRDFVDPYNESERQITYAIHEGADRLMTFHCQLWNELWQGDIRIEGDDDAQRAVRFALFKKVCRNARCTFFLVYHYINRFIFFKLR